MWVIMGLILWAFAAAVILIFLGVNNYEDEICRREEEEWRALYNKQKEAGYERNN